MENGKEFIITLRCVQDVEEFVRLATAQSFPVYLDDGEHRINGKSFMEMFGLNITHPLRVTAECSGSEMDAFRAKIPFVEN